MTEIDTSWGLTPEIIGMDIMLICSTSRNPPKLYFSPLFSFYDINGNMPKQNYTYAQWIGIQWYQLPRVIVKKQKWAKLCSCFNLYYIFSFPGELSFSDIFHQIVFDEMFLVPGNETDGKLSKSIFYFGVQFIHITVKHYVGSALVPLDGAVRKGQPQ